MKLHVGNHYRSRSGKIVLIVHKTYGMATAYPFMDSDGISYTEEGNQYTGEVSENDLVEEVRVYTDPQPQSYNMDEESIRNITRWFWDAGIQYKLYIDGHKKGLGAPSYPEVLETVMAKLKSGQ